MPIQGDALAPSLSSLCVVVIRGGAGDTAERGSEDINTTERETKNTCPVLVPTTVSK